MRGREQRRKRWEEANRDPALGDPTPVVGYPPGGAPYGCCEDEFEEESRP